MCVDQQPQLASGEVPGLFDGDDYTALMSACRESAARDGVIVDSEDELWRRFTGGQYNCN